MKKQTMTLAGIPAILYGSRSRNVYLYLHGKNGCKEEAERFAATACEAGWQVLAIDLPEHGARKNSPERLLPWVAVPEIEAVYARMKPVWAHIRLYGVSIGAWLAMQALQGDAPEQTLLVSPVVDMEALITNMMQYAHVTEEQLQRAGEIPTDLGETLSWPYLCWVREHHGGRGTLVPHPSADGCCANVGRSKPLIFKTIANKNAADGFSSVSGILPILLRDAPI